MKIAFMSAKIVKYTIIVETRAPCYMSRISKNLNELKKISPVMVHVADDRGLRAIKYGTVCIDLCSIELTPNITVQMLIDIFYTHETEIIIFSCIHLEILK